MISDNYIDIAQDEFGAMFDYVINDCKIDLNKFQKLFLNSDVCRRLEENDFLLLSGHSGVELANMIIPKHKQCKPTYPTTYRSKEFWTGWAFIYLWMKSIYTFKDIFNHISLVDICYMYYPYHEMDISHFLNDILKILQGNKLQEYRKKARLSQRDLSILSNVSLKTIQKYERKERLLLSASADILIRLSRALNCSIESLIL